VCTPIDDEFYHDSDILMERVDRERQTLSTDNGALSELTRKDAATVDVHEEANGHK
jgi:hypothetical protein